MRRVVRDNDEFSVVKVCDYGEIVVSCTHEGINIPFNILKLFRDFYDPDTRERVEVTFKYLHKDTGIYELDTVYLEPDVEQGFYKCHSFDTPTSRQQIGELCINPFNKGNVAKLTHGVNAMNKKFLNSIVLYLTAPQNI